MDVKTTMIEHLKTLYNHQLYGDVKIVANILLSLGDNCQELVSMAVRYQALVYQGDAYFNTHEYKRAETAYLKALQMKKLLNKTKGKTTPGEIPNEVDVRLRLHDCYCQLKMLQEAAQVLECISAKQRSARVYMCLAKLYHRLGQDRSAVTSYKEVLRECPLSLEAVHGLLLLGVKGAEVAARIMSSHNSMVNNDWLSTWVKAQAFFASKEYSSAITTFVMLDVKPLLRDNTELLCALGEAQFLNGDSSTATKTLQRVHLLDPASTKNMDLLAYLYYKDKKIKDLEILSSELITVTKLLPEPWVAMAYMCMATKKASRAVYFAQKAHLIDNRCLEALIVKGLGLYELKQYQESILHYREALRLAPHRYEAHKGLIDAYLAYDRTRNAISIAGQAYKQLGTNARSLTLYASVLAKEPLSLEKAKSYLEKAMKLDNTYMEAVYTMAGILAQQQQHDKAIELLKRQIKIHSTCKVHQMLGDFLTHIHDHQEALQQYNIALCMDPNNERAKEGIERVEKHSELLRMDATYDVDNEDMDGSENEPDLEGSDLESGWSDIDVM